VLRRFSYISQDEFFDWNPAVGDNCRNLLTGYWYCVADFAPGELPMPPTVTTQPTPVQTGIASNCVAWYKTTSNETCDDIAYIFASFSKTEFITWNPAVWSDCSNIQVSELRSRRFALSRTIYMVH
jgi:hypothetical protein